MNKAAYYRTKEHDQHTQADLFNSKCKKCCNELMDLVGSWAKETTVMHNEMELLITYPNKAKGDSTITRSHA